MNRLKLFQPIVGILLITLTWVGCGTSRPVGVSQILPPTLTPALRTLANPSQPTHTPVTIATSGQSLTVPPSTTLSQVITTTPPKLTTPSSPSPVPASLTSPQVISFTVRPTTTLTLGESISLAWEAIGEQAAICPIVGTGPAECQDVPLKGNIAVVTDEKAMAYVGFGLRVTTAQSITWSVVDVHLQCQGLRDWFFDNPPAKCPAEGPIFSNAAAQYFEHGFMIWTAQPDKFYIFFDEIFFNDVRVFTFIEAPYTFQTGEPVNETPPPGYYEPVSGFGKIWRGEVVAGVRQHLGWATGPEFGFDTAYQCETPSHPQTWICYLRGPKGEVFQLYPDSSAQVRFLWKER